MTLSGRRDLIENRENIADLSQAAKSFNKLDMDDTELEERMAQMELKKSSPTDEQIAEKTRVQYEKHAKFYAQLYDVLRKRKQIPTQTVNFDKLHLLEKFDETQATQIVLKDTSILNGKSQASPMPRQTAQQTWVMPNRLIQMLPMLNQCIILRKIGLLIQNLNLKCFALKFSA